MKMKADIIVKSIIFNKDFSRILIIQRSGNDPTGANTWEGAGGNLEYGEEPEEAIKREIKEETAIADIRIERAAYVTMVYGKNPYLIIAYLCVSETEAVTLSNEHQAFVWADKKECGELLPKAIIDDYEKNGIIELFADRIQCP